MNWIVIEGLRPWDGRYPFDWDEAEPTTREWGWLKRLAGYLPLTIEDGFKGGDPELFSVIALIALVRSGKLPAGDVTDTYDSFLDAPAGSVIRIEADQADEEADADGPPAASSNGSSDISGDDSRTSLGPSAPIPSATGIPASATSTSAPVRSVI